MILASDWGRLDIVNYLIANSADVNFPNKNGQTALFYGEYIIIITY